MSTGKLLIGNQYSKFDLSEIFDNPNIKLVREGIYNQSDNISFYFVDLEKEGKEDRFHFNDYFEEDYFHWDSQTTQHLKSPKIQEVINGSRIPHLFIRIVPKIKGKTQPYVYCGRLKYIEHDETTSYPVHLIFRNLDFQDDTLNKNLSEIYTWKPEKIGKKTKVQQSKKGIISPERISKYKKPNETERRGLVTSRVGQGFYRQQIREKWGDQCPVTGSKRIEILISSHIIPWSESNNEERLDVNNGILLAPHIDALFDKHLISFTDEGNLILSNKITPEELKTLGISLNVTIPVDDKMLPYLHRHRSKIND
jgi:hypothetical protein